MSSLDGIGRSGRRIIAALLLFWAAGTCASVSPAAAQTLVFHASASGKQTLDQGEGGGNPFASALIEILQRPVLRLGELPKALIDLTQKKSGGFQLPDVPSLPAEAAWPIAPASQGERRDALVLVVSDYQRSQGAQSLPGARHDALRVTAALERAGFKTEMLVDLDLAEMRARLAAFAARTADADAAVIYTTGHGVEVAGTVYLLPGDFPVPDGKAALSAAALPLGEVAAAPRARRVNLLFYGGCRDDPF